MLAVAEYATAPVAYFWNPGALQEHAQPQGAEGRQISQKAEEALRQWENRAENLMGSTDLFIAGCDEDDNDEWTYVSVPPKRTFYVRTQYVFRGKGKPMPFELEDE
jgi:hypothetical protein